MSEFLKAVMEEISKAERKNFDEYWTFAQSKDLRCLSMWFCSWTAEEYGKYEHSIML
ncbi:hypothetical protein ACIQ1D_18215 [Lysinibacillus xylanilyticus]|uniref:hypothetical protein n=1 Tax=Lysinibacillus xylanilyticus TaxID=582475 RepID=UPI00381BC82E